MTTGVEYQYATAVLVCVGALVYFVIKRKWCQNSEVAARISVKEQRIPDINENGRCDDTGQCKVCQSQVKRQKTKKSEVLPLGKDCGTPTVLPILEKVVPISVNYHFTRTCNYKCGFCFHTAKTSFVLPLDEAKKGLSMLRDAGLQKVNFSGGEPFIVQRGSYVGELVKYSKLTLGLTSVSIVSNGSLVTESWFEKYGEHLDILAISCDSFDPDTNEKIGRYSGRKNHLAGLRTVRHLCNQYKVAFKLNTVVNTYNKEEDMTSEIQDLDPCRWKVFQCLLIDGENAGDDAIRNALTYVITDDEFSTFLKRHANIKCLVPESNEKMQNSYLILDEYMRFLDCRQGKKEPSRSLLDVGVENALRFSGFDEKMFFKRGGKYTWSKADMRLEW